MRQALLLTFKMILNLLYYTFWLQILMTNSQNPCELIKTCRECVTDLNKCKWCSADNYSDRDPRCELANKAFKSECDGNFIEDPIMKNISTIENRTYTSSMTEVTQLRPQRFQMVLRPGQSMDLNFNFKAAEDFPADLYFLIDVSSSMEAIKDHLSKIGKDIYAEMLSNTENVFLGLGTFVDKNTPPYVLKPVSPNITYSFRHQLNLTSNYTVFEKKVIATPMGINNDDPESGLDGLAQVLACKRQFGWREHSRKIIIFITDQISHMVGDGKLAGITQPYDGKCHTDDSGNYVKELEMDYPSMHMIKKLAEDATIIFTIEKSQLANYKSLSEYIPGSKLMSFEKKDNAVIFNESQLEKILSDIYKEISKTIEFKLEMTEEDRKHIAITLEPECLEKNNNKDCKVTPGEEKQFTAKVKLLKYYNLHNISINFRLKGINELVRLNIEVPGCSCEAEKIPNSAYCSGKGNQTCGVCECNTGNIGEKCQCSATKNNRAVDNTTCIAPLSAGPSSNLCSGRGHCNCGVCVTCDNGYEGKYCECIKDSCLKKCNGHGKCTCGQCDCYSGFSGEACECSHKRCKQVNGKECNGLGKCECAKCICNRPAAWDVRYTFSDECVIQPCHGCHIKQCYILSKCAVCLHNYDVKACSNECQGIIVNKTEEIDLKEDINDDSFICQNYRVGLGCYTDFLYKYDDVSYSISLVVQKKSNCNESFYWYGGIPLITLIIIGLLTLFVWKYLTVRRDRREYESFIKQHADADSNRVNPIYEPATTTFNNPAFRKPSVDCTLK